VFLFGYAQQIFLFTFSVFSDCIAAKLLVLSGESCCWCGLIYESPDGYLDNLELLSPAPVEAGRLNDTFEPDGVRVLSLAGLRPREALPPVFVFSENGVLEEAGVATAARRAAGENPPEVPRFRLVDLPTGVLSSSSEVLEPVRLGGLLPVRLPGWLPLGPAEDLRGTREDV